MDRDIPTFNQLVINKINQKNLYMHEQRLQNIRSAQNSRAYLSTSMNGRQNKKAQQLQEDKKTQIERHNLMLFNKMKRIMNRQDPHNKPLQQTTKNGNRTSMQLTKIQEENRTMYERIERQKPTISNKKLYQERLKHLNVLRFLGKYSAHSIQNATAQNIKASQASTRTQNTLTGDRKKAYTIKPEHYLQDETQVNHHQINRQRYENNNQFEDDGAEEDFNRMKAIIQVKREKRMNELKDKRRQQQAIDAYNKQIIQKQAKKKRMMQQRTSVPRSAKDIILYKTTKQISEIISQIRILRKHLTYQIRFSQPGSMQRPIKLQFNEQDGNRLLEESNYDYASIIQRLKVVKNQLVLSDSNPIPIAEVHNKYSNQQDLMMQIKNKRKNPFPLNNPSHISEQNQEDSYHVDMREKKHPLRNEQINDQDNSLGEQEQFQKYTTEELSESQNNINFIVRPATFEQKLKQIKQNNPNEPEYKLQLPRKYQIQPQNEQLQPTYEQQARMNGKYEEALDQQID